MLSLKTAFTRSRTTTGRWKEVDIRNEPVKSLPSKFEELILQIDIDAPNTKLRSLKLTELITTPIWESVRTEISVTDWLSSLNDAALPYEKEVFTFSSYYARYGQLFHNGYKVEPIGRHQSAESGGSNRIKEDLYVTKPGVSGETLGRYGLFTVNGLFHLSDYDKDAVYIQGGNQTITVSKDNQVGVLSFSHVGEVRSIPITNDMIHSQSDNASLWDGLYLTIPEKYETKGWVFIFSIGGILHVADATYCRTGERIFRLYPEHFNLIDLYYLLRERTDVSALGIEQYLSMKNPTLLSSKDTSSDKVIRGLLTLPQSFAIAVKADRLFSAMEPIESPFPGRGLMEQSMFNNQLIVGGQGRVIDYHPIHKDGVTTIAGSTNVVNRYDYYYRPWATQGSVDARREVSVPFEHGQLSIRYIGTEK